MKISATLSLLLLAGTMYGQSTLTGANTSPVAGESFLMYYLFSAYPSPGTGGANITWDFQSSTTPNPLDTVYYTTCSSTLDCDSFPGSNLVDTLQTGGNQYTYFSATDTALSTIGFYIYSVAFLGHEDSMHYAGNTLLKYPFTYNDSYSANFYETGNDYATGNERVSGTVSITCDGYGTIITPVGTYTNVLRVVRVTQDVDTVSGLFYPDTYLDTFINYSWYAPGVHVPVYAIGYNFRYDVTTGYHHPVDTIATYALAAGGTAVPVVAEVGGTLDLYPNPATDIVNIKFSFTDKQPITITILDMVGRQVAIIGNDRYEAGEHQLSYNISSLPKGLYFMQLKSGTYNITKKLEVQ